VTAPLLVIIPAFNEEAALPATLDELSHTLDALGIPHQVVVVDDGSSDDTAAVARAAGVTTLKLPFNLGIGGALRTGFRYGVDHGFQRAVQFDADGQHDPNEIPKLLAELDVANLVVGSRFADEESTYEVGTVRRRAMRLLQLTVRLLSGRAFTDTSSGFRGFDRTTLELFARNYPVDYMESVEALVMACASGLRVAEVPVRMRIRSAGNPTTRRFRLAYHYVRLLFIIAVTATRRPRPEGAQP
jgi:glycosyltransferase involved in cell wall biosynthesis